MPSLFVTCLPVSKVTPKVYDYIKFTTIVVRLILKLGLLSMNHLVHT